jgi:hypothetical protein
MQTARRFCDVASSNLEPNGVACRLLSPFMLLIYRGSDDCGARLGSAELRA